MSDERVFDETPSDPVAEEVRSFAAVVLARDALLHLDADMGERIEAAQSLSIAFGLPWPPYPEEIDEGVEEEPMPDSVPYAYPVPAEVLGGLPLDGNIEVYAASGAYLDTKTALPEDAVAQVLAATVTTADLGQNIYVWTRSPSCLRLYTAAIVPLVTVETPEGEGQYAFLISGPLQNLAPITELAAPPEP